MTFEMFTNKSSVIDKRGDSYNIFIYPGPDGCPAEIMVPAVDLLEPAKIYKKMVGKGLDHLRFPGPVPEALRVAVNAEPLSRLFMLDELGWIGADFDAFASPMGIVTDRGTDGRSWVFTEDLQSSIQGGAVQSDISDWFVNCAVPCFYSTAGTIALAAAFAGPLLDVIAEPSFGVAFFGGSPLEADMLAMLAGSVSGIIDPSGLPAVNEPRLELSRWEKRFRNHFVPLRSDGFGRDARRQASLFFSSFYQGDDDERWSVPKEGIIIKVHSPRVVAGIITSIPKVRIQKYFQDIANSNFNPRVISQPLTRGGQRFFDLDGHSSTPEEYDRRINRLRGSAVGKRSTAMKEFAKYLISTRSSLKERVQKLVAEFQASATKTKFEDDASFSSAKCYGLLYAAAILAGDAQLMLHDPSPGGRELTKALFLGAHRDNLALYGVHRSPKDDLLELLKRWEKEDHLCEWGKGLKLSTAGRPKSWYGHWQVKGRNRVFGISQLAMRRELGDKRLALILKVLQDKGAITTKLDPTGNIFQDCGSMPRLEDGISRMRAFVFLVPKKFFK